MSAMEEQKAPENDNIVNGIDTSKFKCLRSKDDGSMYYGEVAYLRKENR